MRIWSRVWALATAALLLAAMAHAFNVEALQSELNSITNTVIEVVVIVFRSIPLMALAFLIFMVYIKRSIDQLLYSYWFWFVMSIFAIYAILSVVAYASPEFATILRQAFMGNCPFPWGCHW